jgi:hypothetical protein
MSTFQCDPVDGTVFVVIYCTANGKTIIRNPLKCDEENASLMVVVTLFAQ